MKRRSLAMAVVLCLVLTCMPRTLASGSLTAQGWGSTAQQEGTEKTPAQKQREEIERLLWYAWLARRYAMMSFADVPEDSWFYPGVCYVWQNSLMSGVSDTSFAPEETASRAMVWTVLARMNKVNTKAGEGEAWYEPGVNWAVRQGMGDGTDPMGGVTREYLAEMLWKCAGGPITPADLSEFSDWGKVSPYADNGVRWAVANGVLQGVDGKLSPQGSVSRAELAAMVMRFGSVLH